MQRSIAQLPPGVVDYYFDGAARRRALENELRDEFRQQGFSEVITPTIEYFDVFERGMRPEMLNQSYRFFNRDGDLLALRADNTCAVARLVATKLFRAEKPLKLFYVNPVYRKENPHAGKFSEFTQAGVEFIGRNSVAADFSILQTAILTLQKIGLSDFQMNLGHVEFVNGIMSASSLTDEEKDRIRKFLADKRLPELEDYLRSKNIPDALFEALIAVPTLVGGEEVLSKIEWIVRKFQLQPILQELTALYHLLKQHKMDRFITIDFGSLKGMSYYTGILFEVFTEALGFPIGNGGRYDRLLQRFGLDLPAVGFSFTLERLEAVL
ncbi:ATP phosphoribosyltransferase regulatory subunit [bacterium BMS3Abin05]|nr:ATP phosphoribosyltransferase regulatory subunit [bacterium BMS3Abin05]